MSIGRSFDIARVNEIANHPSIYPFVHGAVVGPLDLGPAILNPANVMIMGEHGAEIFIQHSPGMYEAHTMSLPEGRGQETRDLVQGALHYLFTHTDAVEVWTRIPQGNRRALALVKSIGGIFDCHVEHGYVMDNRTVPADIYAIRIQDWLRDSPVLEAQGRWFHDRLEEEYERLGVTIPQHADEAIHDRMVGAAVEMIRGGQVQKASVFYDRFARMAGYEPLRVISLDPVTIDIRDAVLIVRGDSFWVASVAPPKIAEGVA